MKRLLEWQLATVTSIRQETPRVKSFTLSLPEWMAHRPGQHYDIRLTAPDGYQAQRSYSIASEPERTNQVDLTIEKLDDGEVSSYMHDVIVEGDLVEVRGPIGGYFVWEAGLGGPLLLIGGGSGVVPLMSMIRHRASAASRVPTRLLYSVRTPEDAIYHDELASLQAADPSMRVFYTYTRSQPPNWTGYSRRIDPQMLAEVARPLGSIPYIFICGPTAMVEASANGLVQSGVSPAGIRTERFGPSGS